MIYRSRKRWGESPQRRRKQGFYAVVKPRNEAENGLLCKRHWNSATTPPCRCWWRREQTLILWIVKV